MIILLMVLVAALFFCLGYLSGCREPEPLAPVTQAPALPPLPNYKPDDPRWWDLRY